MKQIDVLVIPATADTLDDCRRETIDVHEIDQLQALVGGYFEPIDVPQTDGACMWADEEGLLKGKPVNTIATAILAHYAERAGLALGQAIVGDVAVSGYEPVTGERDVPETFVRELLDILPRDFEN